MTWTEWKEELTRLAGGRYGPKGPIAECGEETWRTAFDDGESPEEALYEDMLHWDD